MRKCQINQREMWDKRYFFQFCLICFTCLVVVVVSVVVAFIVACIFCGFEPSVDQLNLTKRSEECTTSRPWWRNESLDYAWGSLSPMPTPWSCPGTASRQRRDIHLLCGAGRRLPNEFRQAAKVEIGFCLLANALWILMWLKRWRRATVGRLFTLFRQPLCQPFVCHSSKNDVCVHTCTQSRHTQADKLTHTHTQEA